MKQPQTRRYLLGMAGILVIIGLSIVGCRLFEKESSSPTVPQNMSEAAPTGNYILSDAESSEWTGYYQTGDPYFKVTIPLIGVMSIRYDIAAGAQAGASFWIFLNTTRPLTHEIGLKTVEVDGKRVTDKVRCVTVNYVENGAFAAMPTELVQEELGKGYVQFEHKSGNDETDEWWPEADAARFLMSPAEQQKEQVIFCDGEWKVGQGKSAWRPAVTTTNARRLPRRQQQRRRCQHARRILRLAPRIASVVQAYIALRFPVVFGLSEKTGPTQNWKAILRLRLG